MFFEDKAAAFSVADVLYLKTDRSTLSHTNGLPCHALTLRKKADSCLFYNDTELKLSGKSLLFIPAAFAYSRRAAQEEMIVIHFWSSSPPAREPTVFPLPNGTIFDDLFDELYRVWKEKEIGYRLKAGELLFSILYQITLEEHAQYRSISPAAAAAELIRRSAEDPCFSVSELPDRLGISGAYLRKLFHAEYRVSPKEYLTDCRMQLARSLLATGYFSIKEVASRSGFENAKYFSTVFKAHCGVPPSSCLSSKTIFLQRPNERSCSSCPPDV